jgi:hypothetical protein
VLLTPDRSESGMRVNVLEARLGFLQRLAAIISTEAHVEFEDLKI